MPTHANKSYGWIKREGKLGGPGYTKKTTAARHRILAGVVKKYGYRSALGSIMALERSTQISATVRKVLVSDRVWLRETYGAASKKALTAAKKTAAQKRAKKTTPRRVPSVARRIRKARAAMDRMPRNTWSAARGSSYPTRKPGESDQSYWRRVNAWTREGVKDATRRHATKYPGFAAWMKKQPKQRSGYTRFGEYVDLNTGGSILTPGDYRDKYAREVKGEAYARYNPRRNPQLPMGATKHASAYVVMWNRGSIERQKVADIYRSRKGGYFVIYTVGSLPHTIIDVERRTASGARDEVHEYLETEVPEMLKTSSGQMRAIKIIPAKGEKVPDAKLKRNGRTECGYHGVPTIRGECVVCAYEADVR